MARTKASVGAKIASGKSSKARCSVGPPHSTAGPSGLCDKSSRSYSGGNSVCPRETPKWQKPITNFFNINDSRSDSEEDSKAGTSQSEKKNNIIHSDNESDSDAEVDRPKNRVLDETLDLEPLSGEECHKIEEYYTKKEKKKGKGKKSNKENIDSNITKDSAKRDLEEDENQQVNKKVKLSEA